MARAGASASPTGAGMRSTTRSSSSSTPTPVLPETLSTSSGEPPMRSASSLRVLLGLGRRQVDLVQHRDDLEVVLEREVEVRERLRLDALRGVDEQDRALARGERAGDLVAEVDVAGGVDHVERVRRVADLPGHAHGLALDRDAALALDVHAVEVLRAHVAVADDARDAEHAVGEGRLAVVDVRDDAEVADQRGVGGSGHRRIGGSRGHPDDSPMTFRFTLSTDAARTGPGVTLTAP